MGTDEIDLRRQQVRDASISASRALRARTGSRTNAYAATLELIADRTTRAARSATDSDDRQRLLATATRQRRLAELDRALTDRSGDRHWRRLRTC